MLQQKNILELLQVIVEEKPAVVTTGAGTPKHFSKALQKLGIKVIPVVATVDHAKKMETLGVDVIIAEGMEAGGHIGSTTTMALLPQVTAAVSLPVIAAGGVASGQAMVAAEALGAAGVQIGTLFLASQECPIGNNYQQKIIEADDTSTIITGYVTGAPVRNIENDYLKKLLEREFSDITKEEFQQATRGSYERAVNEDNVETGSVMAGQIAGQITQIRSVKDIISTLIKETKETKNKLFYDMQ